MLQTMARAIWISTYEFEGLYLGRPTRLGLGGQV
jgi:hypothetical protein